MAENKSLTQQAREYYCAHSVRLSIVELMANFAEQQLAEARADIEAHKLNVEFLNERLEREVKEARQQGMREAAEIARQHERTCGRAMCADEIASAIERAAEAQKNSRQTITAQNQQEGQQADVGAGFDSPATLVEASNVKTAAPIAEAESASAGVAQEDKVWSQGWQAGFRSGLEHSADVARSYRGGYNGKDENGWWTCMERIAAEIEGAMPSNQAGTGDR